MFVSSWLFELNYLLAKHNLNYTVYINKKINKIKNDSKNDYYETFYFKNGRLKIDDLKSITILNINFNDILKNNLNESFSNINVVNTLNLLHRIKIRKIFLPEYKFYLKSHADLVNEEISSDEKFEIFFNNQLNFIKNNKNFIEEKDNYLYLKTDYSNFNNFDKILDSLDKLEDYLLITPAFEYRIIYYIPIPLFEDDFTFPEFLLNKIEINKLKEINENT